MAENHTIAGGLGEAIAALLLRAGVTPPFRQIALPDALLDAGALPPLHDRYGISPQAIAARITGLGAVGRRQQDRTVIAACRSA